MDTTVITKDAVDYGVGSTDRVVFTESKYVIDDAGTLHVHRNDGNVGSFPSSSWRMVLRGTPRAAAGLTEVGR